MSFDCVVFIEVSSKVETKGQILVENKKNSRGGEAFVLSACFCFVWFFLACQRYFHCADVARSASLFSFSWWHLLSSNSHRLHFDVREESSSDDFADVDCSADCSASGFDADFGGSTVEEGDAG